MSPESQSFQTKGVSPKASSGASGLALAGNEVVAEGPEKMGGRFATSAEVREMVRTEIARREGAEAFVHAGSVVREALKLSRQAFAEVLRDRLTAGVDFLVGKNGRLALSEVGLERLRAALGMPASVLGTPGEAAPAAADKNAAAGQPGRPVWVKAKVISAQVMNDGIIVAEVEGTGRSVVKVRPEWRRWFRPGMPFEVRPDGKGWTTRKPRFLGKW